MSQGSKCQWVFMILRCHEEWNGMMNGDGANMWS
jgi:hypothetical protein